MDLTEPARAETSLVRGARDFFHSAFASILRVLVIMQSTKGAMLERSTVDSNSQQWPNLLN